MGLRPHTTQGERRGNRVGGFIEYRMGDRWRIFVVVVWCGGGVVMRCGVVWWCGVVWRGRR
jgi:hypothetical protein